MLHELDQLETQAIGELEAMGDAQALEAWRVKYLGTKGRLKAIMPRIKDVPAAEKPAVGKRLNVLKQRLGAAFDEKKALIERQSVRPAGPMIDVTEPGLPCGQGRRHVITRTIDEITEVFARMGFSVVYGPEVEDEWHNFDDLNIPKDHPARDPIDN